MPDVVIVSGPCGSGKSAALQCLRLALTGRVREVAVVDIDTLYGMIDPAWSSPKPDRERYLQLAFSLGVQTTLTFMDNGFELIAIATNALREERTTDAFARDFRSDGRARVHHVTFDPGLAVLQARVLARRTSEDATKTPEWIASHLKQFREHYGSWTHVIDNSTLSPVASGVAIFEAIASHRAVA